MRSPSRATAFRAALRGLALVASWGLASCGGISGPSENTFDFFSGTIDVGGTIAHPFSAGRTGEFEIRLTELAPATSLLGTAFGQVLNSNCTPLSGYSNSVSELNRTSLGGPISKGTYCVVVYDSGLVTVPVTYTVRVSRP